MYIYVYIYIYIYLYIQYYIMRIYIYKHTFNEFTLLIHIYVCVYTNKFTLNLCVFYVFILYKIDSAFFL